MEKMINHLCAELFRKKYTYNVFALSSIARYGMAQVVEIIPCKIDKPAYHKWEIPGAPFY